MTIDIDTFLDEFDQNESTPDQEKTEEKTIDLDFKEYVENKFDDLKESVSEEDFSFLVKAYKEIKKFDTSLPKKLLELNKSSANLTTELGTKYTDEFLKGIKNNMQKHGTFIVNNLQEIVKLLHGNQVQKAVTLYNEVTKSYKLFPKEFIDEKIELGKKLRQIEININEKFKVFWEVEIKKIRRNLSKEIYGLKQNLVPGRIEIIEEKLHNINEIVDKSPKIFYNELLNERIQISKIIIIAENFLKLQYKIEYEEKEKIFKSLFEKFHHYHLKKDANTALAIYDEMVILFEQMPDVYIDKKIKLYKEINTTFESINNLMLSNTVGTFMETYQHSKILNQTREYLNHANKTTKLNINNLLTVKKNLDKIPLNLKPEKVELEIEIEKLILKHQHRRNINNIENNHNKQNPMNNQKIQTKTHTEIKINQPQTRIKQESQTKTPKKEIKQKQSIPKKELINIQELNNDKLTHINLNMIKEINSNYQIINENNADKEEKSKLVKKIKFYINLLPLTKSQKITINNKITQNN